MQFIARAVKLDLKANEETAFDPHLSSPDELVQYVGQCKEEVDACLAGLIEADKHLTLRMRWPPGSSTAGETMSTPLFWGSQGALFVS